MSRSFISLHLLNVFLVYLSCLSSTESSPQNVAKVFAAHFLLDASNFIYVVTHVIVQDLLLPNLKPAIFLIVLNLSKIFRAYSCLFVLLSSLVFC